MSIRIEASDTQQGVVLLSVTVNGRTNTAKLEGETLQFFILAMTRANLQALAYLAPGFEQVAEQIGEQMKELNP